MLSGRYPTDKLSRHWKNNKSGLCSISGCTGQDFGSLDHILLFYPALYEARFRITELCTKLASENEDVKFILNGALKKPKNRHGYAVPPCLQLSYWIRRVVHIFLRAFSIWPAPGVIPYTGVEWSNLVFPSTFNYPVIASLSRSIAAVNHMWLHVVNK